MGSGICAPWRGVDLGNNKWRCSNNQSYPGGIRDNGKNYTRKSTEECKKTCQNMSDCKFYSVGKGNCMLYSTCAAQKNLGKSGVLLLLKYFKYINKNILIILLDHKTI